MKKIITVIALIAIGFVFFSISLPTQAITVLQSIDNPSDICAFVVLIANIKNIALLITLPIIVLMIIIGGIMITVSAGNDNLRTLGKKTLTGAIIGLVIALLAWVIVGAVLSAIFGANNWWFVESCQNYTGEETPTSDDPTTTDPSTEEFGGTLSGGRAGASPAMQQFLNCFDDYIPQGEDWIITSVIDNDHTECTPSNNGNPLSCDASQCKCGSAKSHCPTESCNSCSSYCSHTRNSCHYGGPSCTDGSYAIDIDTTNKPPRTSDVQSAANKCGGAYVKGYTTHVHFSIGNREGCGCN